LLAEHFVKRFAKDLQKDVQTIADESLEWFKQYHWPGNVREFQSVIKQALLQATGPVLLPEFLPDSIRRRSETPQSTTIPETDLPSLTVFIKQQLAANSTSLYADYQAITDRHLFTLVLEHTAGNLSRAAKLLGITRATLRSKLIALGMHGEKTDGA
jgi:two-component system nitrogen regulation response regulator GlnG